MKRRKFLGLIGGSIVALVTGSKIELSAPAELAELAEPTMPISLLASGDVSAIIRAEMRKTVMILKARKQPTIYTYRKKVIRNEQSSELIELNPFNQSNDN